MAQARACLEVRCFRKVRFQGLDRFKSSILERVGLRERFTLQGMV